MWLKIDDKFHDHPKVVAAGNAAVGLWVRCASYSADYELDGFIPETTARQVSEHYTQMRRLNRVGLWVPTEGGFHLPDFLEYNPSAEEVRDRRKQDAQRKRNGRQRQSAPANLFDRPEQ